MQNTARDTQPVSCAEIVQAISSNPHRNKTVEAILSTGAITDKATPVAWMAPGWTYAPSTFRATPLSLALMAADPLYEISAPNTRRGMEKEAAVELASEFDAMYAKYNGRGRGWVKTGMSTELGLLAGGATETPFDWTALLDKRKILSAVIDVICMKFTVRMAIWWSDHKKLSMWPLNETDDESWASAPILNIEVLTSGEAHVLTSAEGDVRVKPAIWTNVFKTIGEWQWTRPATAPSYASKTLTDLKTEYAELAGDSATLPKKIDKDTLATVIYKYEILQMRLVAKECGFY
jgi:hypothetical protein